MELMLLRLFQRQVRDQCLVTLAAADQINSGLAGADQDQLWIGCQQLLTGAGNVSKALWGQQARHAEERRPLRASLMVAEDSPLRDVSMRNHFEHYDERLTRWWRDSPNHNHLDRMLGSPSTMSGLAGNEMFRVFDPETLQIVFWGERFDVQAIVTEIERIFPIADTEAAKPHWQGDPP